MIVSIDAEKAFDEMYHPFMITLRNKETEGNFLVWYKAHMEEPLSSSQKEKRKKKKKTQS